MNINLDRFWEWLEKWSVGKIMVTLALLIILFKDYEAYPRSLNYFIALGVFLQIFDFCNDHLAKKAEDAIGKYQKTTLNFFMLISILVMTAITYKLLQL